jgi:hypothetical protein
MAGEYKYHLVTKMATGVFSVLAFGIWATRNFKGVMAQVKDTQPDEAIGLVTLAATQELPKLWKAFQEPVETPLA